MLSYIAVRGVSYLSENIL